MSFDVKTRISLLKSSAKQRGIHVNMDINKYQILIDNGCHFCGKNLKDENGYCLDRIDSNKSYIISNVVACCKICNRAKSNMDVHDFIKWIHSASEHLKKQNKFFEELNELGITEEMYVKLEEEFFKEMTKNQTKNRLKFVP